ncbi:hypothetical protein D6C85_07445 [Aureobasidium pullulans]|uniref:Uncharacterized protein n=1 Tax=Aureobasidium pullulans TaxID=5580 RepID=A0A4S9WS83_AURPU|nr:hypothetical protein D6C85_07445 [Aureobasidium pullulans]
MAPAAADHLSTATPSASTTASLQNSQSRLRSSSPCSPISPKTTPSSTSLARMKAKMTFTYGVILAARASGLVRSLLSMCLGL